MKRKHKIRSLTVFVVFSFAMLIAYTVVSQVIFVKTGVETSTLNTCFFGAFGGEVLMCALIKVFKLKKGDNDGGSQEETQ